MQGTLNHLRDPMSTTNLKILQLTIMRSRAGMEALINDPKTQDLDILLIREPPVTAYRTHVHHRLWQLYQPTYSEETRKRSILYVNTRVSTSAHRQINCNSPDVAAVKILTDEIQVLVFAVYIPPLSYRQSRRKSMQPTLDKIQRRSRRLLETPTNQPKLFWQETSTVTIQPGVAEESTTRYLGTRRNY